MSIKHWIRYALVAAVLVAAFGLMPQRETKPADAQVSGISACLLTATGVCTAPLQAVGSIAVTSGSKVMWEVIYDNPTIFGQIMAFTTGFPWLAGNSNPVVPATPGPAWTFGQGGCTGNYGQTIFASPVFTQPSAVQIANAAAMTNLGVIKAVETQLITNATSDVTVQFVPEAAILNVTGAPGGLLVAASTIDGCYVSLAQSPGVGPAPAFAPGAPLSICQFLLPTSVAPCGGTPAISAAQAAAMPPVPFVNPFVVVSFMTVDFTSTINCAAAPITPITLTAAQGPVTWTPQVAPNAIIAPGGATPTALGPPPVPVGVPVPPIPPLNNMITSAVSLNCNNTQATSAILVRKIDQFANPLSAIFAVQTFAGSTWVDVTRLQTATCAQIIGPGGPPLVPSGQFPAAQCPLGAPGVNPCSTASTACAFPAFTTGLLAGTYRIIEVSQPNNGNPSCTLVNIFQGPLPASLGGPGGGNETPLPPTPPVITLPLTANLPATNVTDATTFTFVNSCLTPGAISGTASQVVVVIGGSSQGLTNTANVEINPAPGSDDDARIDVRVRDALNIPMIGAHVTFVTDKGRIAVRRAFDTTTLFGIDVIEPNVPLFGTNLAGDTCDYALTQNANNGIVGLPYINSSPTAQDGFTDGNGIVSACALFGTDLAPGTPPGIATITIYVEQNGASNFAGYGVLNLAPQQAILTAKITVVGPPASITVSASPTTLNCGEKATVTVTIKDAANQNVSDHTRFEAVTNAGGVLGGTGGTLGFPGVGPANPVSSAAGETFNGTGTIFLLTSTSHVGPYEVVVTSGGSTGGQLAPIITQTTLVPTNNINTTLNQVVTSPGALQTVPANYALASALPTNGGTLGTNYFISDGTNLLPYNVNPVFVTNNVGTYGLTGAPTGVFSTPPVSSQVTVNCTMPVAASPVAIPAIQAPRTGEGPVIRPPNTGDAGLASLFQSDW